MKLTVSKKLNPAELYKICSFDGIDSSEDGKIELSHLSKGNTIGNPGLQDGLLENEKLEEMLSS